MEPIFHGTRPLTGRIGERKIVDPEAKKWITIIIICFAGIIVTMMCYLIYVLVRAGGG